MRIPEVLIGMKTRLFVALLGCFALTGSALSQDHVVEQSWSCKDSSIVRYGKLPSFSIDRQEHTPGAPNKLIVQLSISTKNAGSSADLVLLACKLASDFAKENAIDALIFDDRSAAKNLALYATDQTNWGEYIWHLRAHYPLNRATGQQWLDLIMPKVDSKNETSLFTLQQYRISIPLEN
jgi:hypothetical protein